MAGASSVPVGFIDRFTDDFIMLSQQQDARLAGLVRTDPDMLMGRFGYYDRIGAVSMQLRTQRHADTGIIEVPHSRRRVTTKDYELPMLLDKQDLMRLIADPKGKWMMNALAAANRQKDDIIIAAADANAFSIDEDNAATAVPLPNSQIIVDGGTTFSIDKVYALKEVFDAAEINENEQRHIFVNAKAITKMLKTTEVKSQDYNVVKVLVEGKIDTFLGFKWHRTERLKKTGNIRRCIAFSTNGIGLAVGEDVTVDIGPRRDKGNATQLLVTMSADATRIEDEKVGVIDYDESIA
jgi:hypothetical protein